MAEYDAWLNQPVETTMRLDPWPARALAATLGQAAGEAPDESGDLPCLWHWLYFLETPAHERIAADGHAERGEFLPPIPHPRRMYAGGRTTVHRPLRLGADATLVQTVTGIQQKGDAADGMWLVTVGYDYHQGGVLSVHDERDYLYLTGRASPPSAAPSARAPSMPWRAEVTPDPVMLMRFSALTFNGHRIHYDRDYAVEQEGYGERVVHGPLTAILLAETARRESGRAVATFTFRARSPLLADRSVTLAGTPDGDNGADLAAYDDVGRLAMTAKATFT